MENYTRHERKCKMEIQGYSLQEWVISITIVIGFIELICEKMGWNKGRKYADALQDALKLAQGEITNSANDLSKIEKCAEYVASKVDGVTSDMVKPLILKTALNQSGRVESLGIDMTITSNGDINVDPSGLISKSIYKAGKFLRKVF